MSRTFKTRPKWVKLNDPKFPTKEHHQHYVVKREKSGKMETHVRHLWIGAPDFTVSEEYEVPHYYTWVETVPCTLDIPEVSWQHWKSNKEKLCERRELLTQGCGCCSRKNIKSLTNGAKRSKVNQALHNAVRDHGKTDDPASWWDVDINPTSKYDSPYWWD